MHFVTEKTIASPFTLEIDPVRTIPGSDNVRSARVEGDAYLTPDRLSNEGQSAAE
jgi:hypothetical protein